MGVAELKSGIDGFSILAPRAELIVFDILNQPGLDRVLVNVAEQGSEILHIVDRF